jgi:hypothetical protein
VKPLQFSTIKSGKLPELILRLYILKFVRAGEIAVAAILRKYPPILSKPFSFF